MFGWGRMTEPTLFELPPTEERVPAPPTRPEEARVLQPNRQQLQFLPRDLDAALAEDHSARAIWGLLEKLDLSAFYGSIKATLDRPGRPTTDPKVLLALWLLGTVEGIGSARKLARLCQEHDAYRWLCGGVPINYHMLSDFRVAHEGALDELLTQIAASLMAAGAVTLERVAQDGMRVRASAGASSFRRQETLEKHLEEARAQVARLAQEREHPDPGVGQRGRKGACGPGASGAGVAIPAPGPSGEGTAAANPDHSKAGQGDPAANLHHGPPGSGNEDARWRL